MKQNSIFHNLILIVSILFIIGFLMPLAVYAADWEGNGLEDEPYLLKTSEDLKKLSTKVKQGNTFSNVFFKFENDITLPDNWLPIGTVYYRFAGRIDGAGHTLTVPVGSYSLIGTPENAYLSNLKIYGERIPGYGVIQNYIVGSSMRVTNVTILAGSHILYSGFLGGYGNESVHLINCTVEKGVVIGDDGTWGDIADDSNNYPWMDGTYGHKDMIGSFGGAFNGNMIGCVSYATVYGNDYVGGICGMKGQSMREMYLHDCEFHGEVIATGEYVGGILGCGYNAPSAPNTPAVTIENCLVSGNVTGKSKVGGILGAEVIGEEWPNGVGFIRNNIFTGEICSSGAGADLGGIIGLFYALNRYNVIENNYYSDSCGVQEGIGHIDKICFKDGEGWTIDGYRLDDPQGEDKEKLTKAMPDTAFKDSTVVNYLNAKPVGTKWRQGGETPVISKGRHVVGITSGGWYTGPGYPENARKELATYPGQELYQYTNYSKFDDYGILIKYSDGSYEMIQGKDAQFSGVDFTKLGTQMARLTYGGYAFDFEVNIVKVILGNDVVITVTIIGDTPHGDNGEQHTYLHGGLIEWVQRREYTGPNDEKVLWFLQQAFEDAGIECHMGGSNYIAGLTFNGVTLMEKDNGPDSGWMYTINDWHSDLGVAEQGVEDGDEIVFHYTDNYHLEDWMEGDEGANQEKIEAVQAAIALIPDIEDLTLDDQETVDNALALYNALTYGQQSLMMYDEVEKLMAAKDKIEDLIREKEAQQEAERKLAEAKTDATAELESYKDTSDYREAEQQTLAKIIAEGKDAIDEAETLEAVQTALDEYKERLDAVKTDAQLTEEEEATEAERIINEARSTAKTAIEGYVTADDYREAEAEQLAALISEAKTVIDAASITEEVEAVLAEYKGKIDKLKTATQYEAEEAAEAERILNEARSTAKSAIEGYVTADDYREAEAEQLAALISEAETVIDAASITEEVEAVLAEYKGKIDKLKTATQYEAEEAIEAERILNEARSNAKTAIEGYVSADDYREAEAEQLAILISEAKTAIDAASTTEAIDSVLAEYKGKIGKLKAAVQYEAEEAAEAERILNEARSTAKTAIEGYVSADDYREAEAEQLAVLISEAKAAIDAASTTEAIDSVLAKYKGKIGKLKAAAQYEAAEAAAEAERILNEAKSTAKAAIESYKSAEAYRDAEKALLTDIIEAAKTGIDAASTTEEIDAVLADQKSRIDALKTDAEYTAEETAAEAERTLNEAKGNAKIELGLYKAPSEYREAEKEALLALLREATEAIDKAETVDEINAIAASCKAEIDKLKTDAEYQKEEEQQEPEKITRKKQPMKVKAVKLKKTKAAKLKKKKISFRALKISKAEGKVSFKVKANKKSKKALKFNKKTRKITVRKGTKKGLYKLKIRVRAAGNSEYLAGSKTVTIKVRVK